MAKNHIQASVYNAQDSYPLLVFFLSQLKNVYIIKCGGTLLAGPKKDIGTDLLQTASRSSLKISQRKFLHCFYSQSMKQDLKMVTTCQMPRGD